MKMRPALTGSSPAMRRSVVDWRQREGPSSTTSVPAAASKLTPSTARVVPQTLLTPRTEIADIRRGEPRPRAGPVSDASSRREDTTSDGRAAAKPHAILSARMDRPSRATARRPRQPEARGAHRAEADGDQDSHPVAPGEGVEGAAEPRP